MCVLGQCFYCQNRCPTTCITAVVTPYRSLCGIPISTSLNRVLNKSDSRLNCNSLDYFLKYMNTMQMPPIAFVYFFKNNLEKCNLI